MNGKLPKMSHSRAAGAIVAALILPLSAAASDAQPSDAVKVFHCRFDEEWDENYDAWPDRWTRTDGPQYPHYVGIEIEEDSTAPGGKCLSIDLDGAAAAVSSPPIRVMSRFGYVFEASIKTERLEHSTAMLSLDFYDKAGRVVQSRKSKPIASRTGWQRVRMKGIEPNDAAIDRVVISLNVTRGDRGDLKGRVSLADIWLARLPRIGVSTNNVFNVYPNPDDVVVRCELSGIRERNPEIRFQLLDATGKTCDAETFQLDGQLIVEDSKHEAEVLDGVGQAPAGYEGSKQWQPKISDFGFYQVVVKMLSSQAAGQTDAERELDSRTVWLAVVPPLEMPKKGEFGWSLPQGDRPLSFPDLSRLLPQLGISWVKLPVWFDANDPRRGDELIRFIEFLGASNIEVVGIIDKPPATSATAPRMIRDASVADVLTPDTSTWSPSLEPVMTRLSLRVRWWQLGRDGDTSLAGFPGLNKKIDELRTKLFRFGQDVRMGMCWDWASAGQNSGKVAWDFEQLTSETTLTESEFRNYLAKPWSHSARRWVLVEPPRATDAAGNELGDLNTRATEFVHRLVTAKQFGASAIIVSNPFNDENGLMHANGMPAELLLPWRTTAALLGGGEYLGELQLPSGSTNRIFRQSDGRVVMVVWNAEPTEETLYLGDDVRHYDAWGRALQPATKDRQQTIRVGPVPSFVVGLHEAITRWRMAMNLERHEVPSVFGKPHPNALSFRNFFPQGVGGSLRIVVPQEEQAVIRSGGEHDAAAPAFTADRWNIEPPQGTFQLAAGDEIHFPFEIRLKDALYGNQPVRIEFNIEADETYQFDVYRTMAVGTADLRLEVKTHIDKDGSLIVEQFMTNRSDEVADFRCYLYAKGHRPKRMQVYRLGTNQDRKVYRYPNGMSLVGNELYLEIEELNGPRVLKYRFIAAEGSDSAENMPDDSTADPGRTEAEAERVLVPAANTPGNAVWPLKTGEYSSAGAR